MSVLVAYASRHGATSEIAAAIAEELERHGAKAELREVSDVEGCAAYDAVVLGSAVYMGQWLEPARAFAQEHAAELAARRVWLFSSGPLGDPPKPDEEKAVQIAQLVEATRAEEHRLFSGKVDRSGLGFGERAVVLAVRAPEGDFRDWDEIRAWAREIAAALGP